MRTFLKRLSLFTLFTLVVFIGLFVGQFYIINTQASFQLKPNVKNLFLGHSHSQRAYNDSIIPNAKNLSSSSESYFYTLAKTRKLIEQNPQIKTVFIECSNNQLNKEVDYWTWGKGTMPNRLHIYGPFLNYEEFKLLALKNPKLFLKSTSILFRKSFDKIFTSSYEYTSKIDGYYWVNKTYNEDQKKRVNKKLKDQVSHTNILFLRKIVDYLRAKNIKPILIRTPTLPVYKNNFRESSYDSILKTQFNDIDYIDFSEFIMPEKNYEDPQHLNYLGAKEFSSWFASLIEEGLIDSKDKQLFVNSRLKKNNNFKK